MRLLSPNFQEGEIIPTLFTCYGTNISPTLEFHDLPDGAQSLILMVEDIDAPANPWVHWLVFNIPVTTLGVVENGLPKGGVEGLANGGTFGYEGPCMKYFTGIHHYVFRLIALDTMLNLPPESDRNAVLAAMKGHVLEEAMLTGLAEGDGSAL